MVKFALLIQPYMTEQKLLFSPPYREDRIILDSYKTPELSLKDELRDPLMAFGPMEGAILVGLFLILFGPSQLPKLARSLGQAKSEFNKGLVEGDVTSSTEDDLDRGGMTESVALVEEAKSKGVEVDGRSPEDIKQELKESE